MKDLDNAKWYQNKALIIILFFILPPLGIYGMTKRKSVGWKKALYIVPASFLVFFTVMGILGLIFMNPYEDGIDYYNKQDYIKAYKNLKMVNPNDPNYNDAILKIKEIKPIVDSLTVVIENSSNSKTETESGKEISKIDLIKLKEFQKKWADSVVLEESKVGNRHLVNSKLISPDTIYFEYTEGVTKNGFNVNIQNDTIMYRSWYKKSIASKLGDKYASYPVHITCIPNHNVDYQKIVQENQIKSNRREKIQRQFSAWNGSHTGLKRLIKENMHDPSSFEHIETIYADKGKYILVQMKYRGKNSLGATVINITTAKVDLDGNILSVQ